MDSKIRILFSIEAADQWILEAYRGFFDSLASGSYEIFCTVHGIRDQADLLRKYNVIDCEKILYAGLNLPTDGLSSMTSKELTRRAQESSLWNSPEQMREFYRFIDIYVCASHSEGTPNPCLEAAACGVPLVTTRVGNMPELIEDGTNGLFIEHDINDIIDKLILLRDNQSLRQDLSKSILRSIQDWDWHENLQVTPLMHYIAHEGGQYFGYDRMQDGQLYDVWKWRAEHSDSYELQMIGTKVAPQTV